MKNEIYDYAKKRLDLIKDEVDGIKDVFLLTHGAEQNLYIELSNGMNLKLHDDEVLYQAESFFNSKLEEIKNI